MVRTKKHHQTIRRKMQAPNCLFFLSRSGWAVQSERSEPLAKVAILLACVHPGYPRITTSAKSRRGWCIWLAEIPASDLDDLLTNWHLQFIFFFSSVLRCLGFRKEEWKGHFGRKLDYQYMRSSWVREDLSSVAFLCLFFIIISRPPTQTFRVGTQLQWIHSSCGRLSQMHLYKTLKLPSGKWIIFFYSSNWQESGLTVSYFQLKERWF